MPKTLEDALNDLSPEDRAEVQAESAAMILEYQATASLAQMHEAMANAARYLIEAQRFMTVSGSSMTIALTTATGKVEVSHIGRQEDLLHEMLQHAL